MSTEDKIEERRKRYCISQSALFHVVLEACDSPIERLFVATMMSEFMWTCDTLNVFHQELSVIHGVGKPRAAGVLYSIAGDAAVLQAPVSDSRGALFVDIALLSETRRVAIELDGHDFHERTKEQAKRDRSRERRLTSLGWTVVRFTGSEVYQDAEACVREALSIFRPLSEVRPLRVYVDSPDGSE